jgi:hypothetical protein
MCWRCVAALKDPATHPKDFGERLLPEAGWVMQAQMTAAGN